MAGNHRESFSDTLPGSSFFQAVEEREDGGEPPKRSGGDRNVNSPWRVVEKELQTLANSLDVTVLRSHLWSASLIEYPEYCELESSSKTKPERTEDLLTEFIERDNVQEFNRFVRTLESVPTYLPIAIDLKAKAEELARRSQSEHARATDDSALDGGMDRHQSPWKVVKEELPNLKNTLDVTVLRSNLYSASLIDYKQYCDLELSTTAKPDRAERLLSQLVETNDDGQFYRFLEVLESVPAYHRIAVRLKTRAGVQARESGSGSQVCPFVVVRRMGGKLCGLAVDGEGINKINAWDNDDLDKKQVKTETANSWSTANARKAIDDKNLWKSENLLSKRVKRPPECKDKGNAGIVVLAGQVAEIIAWLRENGIVTEEQALGKILHSSIDDDVGATDESDGPAVDAVSTSGLFCVLPPEGNTLYVVVRLRWMDEPEVQLKLLRIALEMSPMWLIFYNRTGIEQNGFCAEAYREPEMSVSDYFEESSNDAQITSARLVDQLRQVINCFPYGNNFVQPLAVLHIEYVFDVSLQYFSSTMVYHNPLMEDSQAKCVVQTYEKFDVLSDSKTNNPAIAQVQQGIPDLTVGVSLRRRLQKSDVEAYPVDLRWWLQMSSCYVEVPVLSCSSHRAESEGSGRVVNCSLFPAQVIQGVDVAGMSSSAAVAPNKGVALPFANESWKATEKHDMATSSAPGSAYSGQTSLDNLAFSEADGHFENIQEKLGSMPDGVMINSGQNADEPCSKAVSKMIRKAMDGMKLPPSLAHTFLKWRGPVQAIVCVAADMQKACEFLNKLTGSNLGLFANSKVSSVSAEATSETHRGLPRSDTKSKGEIWHSGFSPVSTSDSHRDFPPGGIWMCCRPSDAVLYVLMYLEHWSLGATACPKSDQESVALVTAAALANMFVVLTEGFPQEANILEGLLLPGLQHFGKCLPGRGKNREKQLFNGVLVPVVDPADLDEKSTGKQCCTKHFQQIYKDKSWKACRNDLCRFFVGVHTICSKTPVRSVANLLSESRLCHKSGTHFQQMLRLILAAVKIQGERPQSGGSGQLQHLLIGHIMASEWEEFRNNLKSALTHGKVKGKRLLGCPEERPLAVESGAKKVTVNIPTTLEFSLSEESSVKPVKYTVCQQGALHKLLEKLGEAVCVQQYGLNETSYKNVPPFELKAAFDDALTELVKRRKDDCTTWCGRAIKEGPFDTSDNLAKECKGLISRFEQQWGTRCEAQCEGSTVHGGRCLYRCLLPKDHRKDEPHNCFDPTGKHNCEHRCKLCKLEGVRDAQLCTQAAGHQHTSDDEKQLHKCGKQHLCEEDCDLSEARNCSAEHRHAGKFRAGKCKYRIDHHRGHICEVSPEHHLCKEPCRLRGTPGCDGGRCNKVYGQHDSETHLCLGRHTCQEFCDHPGVCMLDKDTGKHKLKRQRLQTGRDGWRLQCRGQEIGTGKDRHDEPCRCGKEHTCNNICPFCECYCRKEYDHGGLCEVEHGEICTEMEVFSNIDKRVIPLGDGGLRCDNICVEAGRGHEHKVVDEHQQNRRITHDKFWPQHNLVDPYIKSDVDYFCGCPDTCQHFEHGAQSPKYCTGRLKHRLFLQSSLKSQFSGEGYISHKRNGVPEGHHFDCTKHTCSYSGAACKKKRLGNVCDQPCTLALGHADDCTCDYKHECDQPCAAKGCPGKCKKPADTAHSGNCSCGSSVCIQDCELCDLPKKKCSSEEHLHKPFDGEKHNCKQDHPCKAMCEQPGICVFASHKQTSSATVFQQKGSHRVKLNCAEKRPTGQSHHWPLKHDCQCQHTCDKRCPFCEHYCQRVYGHIGKCKTEHGLAKKVGSMDGVQIIKASGEKMCLDEHVTCAQICHCAGRGHFHIMKCNCEPGWTKMMTKPKRKHLDTDASTNGGSDLVFHSEFWESHSSGFVDPASEAGHHDFELCGALCPCCLNNQKFAACMEPLLHKPCKRGDRNVNRGFVGPKSHPAAHGHRFDCDGHMCKNTCTNISLFRVSCTNECNGIEGHANDCQCEKHWGMCKEICKADNCTTTCAIPPSTQHNVHKCNERCCKVHCDFDGCSQNCANDHVHVRAEEEELTHHCGQPHQCRKMCKNEVCVQEARQVDSSLSSCRLQCKSWIMAGMREHNGDCSCGTVKRVRMCETLCPLCNCACKYNRGHNGLHDFNHGSVSVRNPQVRSPLGEIMTEGRSCSEICKNAGRGHTHPLSFPADQTQRTGGISPDGQCVLHSYFWKLQGIEDPLGCDKGLEMDRCPTKCPTCNEQYCTEKLRWHSDIPVESAAVGPRKARKAHQQGQKISHKFPCQH